MIFILDLATTKFLNISAGKDYTPNKEDIENKILANKVFSTIGKKIVISKVAILNYDEKPIFIKDIEEYLSSPYFSLKDDSIPVDIIENERRILLNSRIFNKYEIDPFITTTNLRKTSYTEKTIKSYVKRSRLVYFMGWMSPLLLTILSNHKKICGFKESIFYSNNELKREIVKINNDKKHFDMFLKDQQLMINNSVDKNNLQGNTKDFLNVASIPKKSNTYIVDNPFNLDKKNDSELVNEFIFKQKPNKTYQIVFDKEIVDLNKMDYDGMFYVHQILRRGKDSPITASELYRLRVPFLKEQKKKLPFDLDDHESEQNIGFRETSDSFEIVDKQYEDDLKREIKKYRQKLEDAEEFNDEEKISIYKAELDDLEVQYAKIKIPGRKGANNRKRSKSSEEKAKGAIDEALRRLKKKVQTKYPNFYDFLCNEIKNEYRQYTYKPLKERAWILD